MKENKILKKKFLLLFKIFNAKNLITLNNKIQIILLNLYDGKDFHNILNNVNKKKLINSVNIQRLKNNPIKVKKSDLIEIVNS